MKIITPVIETEDIEISNFLFSVSLDLSIKIVAKVIKNNRINQPTKFKKGRL